MPFPWNEESRARMARPRFLVLGVCFLVFSGLLYSALQLRTKATSEISGDAQTSWEDYREDESKSARTSPEHNVPQVAQIAFNTTKNVSTGVVEPAQCKSPEPISMALKIANESALKLQYALDSKDIHFEDPHLYSFGRYINTLTDYLGAMLSDTSVDQQPFHRLREQLFPWWSPSADKAYLPWDKRDHRPKAGVVLTAGKGNFILAAHCIQTLHHVVKSSLPIQVYYGGDRDLPEAMRDELKSLHPNLETIDILDGQFNETIAGLNKSGYAMKPFAALASSFERVVLVDADTIFLRRPDEYFDEHPGLHDTGLHYFHDRAFNGRVTTDWVKKLKQAIEPSTTLNESLFWRYELEHHQESGVVFFNKALPTAFMSLLFTTYINTQKVRDYVYNEVFGDKETYWLASELSSAPYTFAANYASIIGNLPTNPSTSNSDSDSKVNSNSESNSDSSSDSSSDSNSDSNSAPQFDFNPNSDSDSPDTTPTNPTDSLEICSAQLLHLDQHSKPFWFNSGLRLEKMIDSTEYANLTHYLPGASATAASMDEQFGWNFRSHHTFCVTAEREKWRSLEDAGLKGVADEAVEEAKRVDVRFLGHEGGEGEG